MEIDYAYQSVLPQQHNKVESPVNNGLRRIQDLDNNIQNNKSQDEVPESEEDLSLCYGSTVSIITQKDIRQSIEDQKHQLFGICEVIQTQVRFTI